MIKAIKKFNKLVRVGVLIFVAIKLLIKFVDYNTLKHGLTCGLKQKFELLGLTSNKVNCVKHEIESKQFEK
ncbi:hypothetical protein IMX26_05340 [Clostridium sp. 'deep sea']|uniref:hypothetical protein n=1 Tax=Clostridium sp. 'deep sea' TaxID=2779445 RepID=UPI001896A326|nr:hypothetical protein [Clostridium sp. 'deep sea']QOR36238.1 hypothetical protein IMX26_05340 [Clostridium sp. 'deep sea']